jgi:Ca2+-binding EF-hand superfamily protein
MNNMNRTPVKLAISLIAATFALSSQAEPGSRMLKKIDTDNDGVVSFQEFQSHDRGFFQRLDTDGDGAVSIEDANQHLDERMAEHRAEMAEREAEMKARLNEHLTSADANQDGIVTREEAELAAFSHIDENGDGYLSPEELKNARPKHAHRHKRGAMHGKWGGRS